ncbi:hypothetical protein [Rhizobium leguminosarum]|uniref:hypothetical protein n=1 Tax=Rhizobium leguminosarum TaxID=384 RepID=UPI0013F15A49|nr:hypothetical protein [Rhizobium leguminosarum]MBY5791100.1 hypothetical protein [Rhizobium leguminosarum]
MCNGKVVNKGDDCQSLTFRCRSGWGNDRPISGYGEDDGPQNPGRQACCCQSAAGLRSVGSIEAEVKLAAILLLVAAKKKTRLKLISDTFPIKAPPSRALEM